MTDDTPMKDETADALRVRIAKIIDPREWDEAQTYRERADEWFAKGRTSPGDALTDGYRAKAVKMEVALLEKADAILAAFSDRATDREGEADEATVERGARSMWESDEHTPGHDTWSSLPEYGRDLWRDRARACLAPARQPIADPAGEERIADLESQNSYWFHAFGRANAEVATLTARLAQAEGERDALQEAITPSGDTKAAYIGEIKYDCVEWDEYGDEQSVTRTLEWTTTKDVMVMIAARAALATRDPQAGKLSARQPCDTCGKPVAVHAVSPSECFCSTECADPQAEGGAA